MKAAVVGQDIAPDTRGARLRRLRIARRLTIALAAKSLGITQPYLSLLERNQETPSRELLFRLSDFYGVSVHFIERGREFCYSDCFTAGATGSSSEVQP